MKNFNLFSKLKKIKKIIDRRPNPNVVVNCFKDSGKKKRFRDF